MSKTAIKLVNQRSKLDFAPWRLYVKHIALVLTITIAATAKSQEPSATSEAESATPPPAATPQDGEANSDDGKPAPPGDDLSVQQARLADRFKRLEEVVSRLAELSASSDPRRAKLLREAIAQSREQDVNLRFETIVDLLEEERLSVASTNQSDLQKELDALLTLLLKADRDRELSSQRDRVRHYLKKVGELIRQQKGVRARTEGGDDLRELGEDQKRIAGDTGKLSGDIATTESSKNKPGADADSKAGEGKKDDQDKDKPGNKQSPKNDDAEKKPGDTSKPGQPSDKGSSETPDSKPGAGKPADGKPSDGKPSSRKPSKPGDSPPSNSPPSPGQPGSPGDSDQQQQQQSQSQPQDPADRAAERLRAAQQQMEDALKKIAESERKGAADEQIEAIKDLERAKAELERILRQLREEEMERTLTQLAARFRKMLELQMAVYEGTVRVDRVPEADRDHDDEIEAARLGRNESKIVHEADKTLLVLHEDGSSAAFPEAIEQMRDDMRQVADRLAAVKVGTVTQELEKDIMAALEETIAAIEKAAKDLEKKRTPPGQQPAAGQPPEPPLVDKLAELKMIRSLQMRINLRTQRYGKMIAGEQAETPDLIAALKALAEKQQRVFQATADLEQGRND
jgi:hypothetical protein